MMIIDHPPLWITIYDGLSRGTFERGRESAVQRSIQKNHTYAKLAYSERY